MVKHQAIEALPDPIDPGRPLAEELTDADRRHDQLGLAVHHLCKAIEVHPDLDGGTRETVARVLQTFLPRLDLLKASYADEAAAALDARGKLAEVSAEAGAVAAPGGGSLLSWLTAFLDAGDEIDRLLRDRAQATVFVDNAAAAGALRGGTVGLLGRFRAALRDEMEDEQSALPADYEARLFAYIDQLGEDRAVRAVAEGEGQDEPAPEPVPVPTPGGDPAPEAGCAN